MGRDRYQEGRIVLVGKHIQKWRGHFYVYQKQADGSEVRRHRNVPLGLKSGWIRVRPKAKIQDIIARQTKDVAPAPVNVTLRWFYENRMFQVLGLPPGEMFALRWNDQHGNSLRIDSSITDGMEVETKPPAAILRLAPGLNRHGARILTWYSNQPGTGRLHFSFNPRHRDQHEQFPFRVLKEAGRNAGIDGVTHQMLRRTCSTYMAQITSVKDVQAHLRHMNAKTALEHYIKSVPERPAGIEPVSI